MIRTHGYRVFLAIKLQNGIWEQAMTYDDNPVNIAENLVKEHGTRGIVVAAFRVGECTERCDLEGSLLWGQVIRELHKISEQHLKL